MTTRRNVRSCNLFGRFLGTIVLVVPTVVVVGGITATRLSIRSPIFYPVRIVRWLVFTHTPKAAHLSLVVLELHLVTAHYLENLQWHHVIESY